MRLTIPTSPIFLPLLEPHRYKGAYGGRGSGKSHFFAEYVVEETWRKPGTRVICIREIQKTLADSSKALIEDKIRSLGLSSYFNITKERIVTPGDGAIMFTGLQSHNSESIKSLEGASIAWCDEAQALSERSLQLLRPTIRVEGSELWFSWNPTRKQDAIEKFLRGPKVPSDACVVKANYKDNAFFNDTLEQERLTELEIYPERYPHTWLGEYAAAFEGAYYATHLAKARKQGRIGHVGADEFLPIYAFWDIGGAGKTSDANAVWICQWVGQEIRVLDYLETQGQTLGYVLNEMRKKGWEDVKCYLPHDGINENNITGKRYRDHLEDAGYEVEVIPNQGRGAAMMRIEAVRRIFPKCWFNEEATEEGRQSLGFYHEKMDEERKVGLGPDHDWSSHAADAFGLMAVCYEDPSRRISFNRELAAPKLGIV